MIAHESAAAVIEARQADGQKAPKERFGGECAPYAIDGSEFVLVDPGQKRRGSFGHLGGFESTWASPASGSATTT